MTTAKTNIGSVTMPPGEYWVGDPCYSVPDDRWMEWLEAADYTKAERYLIAELDGRPVLGISTAYGDGSYLGSDGREYPVDAGLIGLVPVELVEEEPFGAHKVMFTQPVECSYDKGVISLGYIDINTEDEDGLEYQFFGDEEE